VTATVRRLAGPSRSAGVAVRRPFASYVFCLVECPRQPSLPKTPRSLPLAGPPRLLLLDRDIWLVAADAPLREYSKTAIERCLRDLDCVSTRALAHEAMVTFFFNRWPVIPLKLFTLFTTDDRAMMHLRRRVTQIRRVFDVVRDHEEWGVRLTINPDEVPAAPLTRVSASGRDYLEAKKRRRQRSSHAAGAARRAAATALNSLGTLATRDRRQQRPAPATSTQLEVLEAAYLVPARKAKAWRARARSLGLRLATCGCRIEITGPWPPYNFVSVRAS